MPRFECFFEGGSFYWLPLTFFEKNDYIEYSVIEWGFWSFLIYKIK